MADLKNVTLSTLSLVSGFVATAVVIVIWVLTNLASASTVDKHENRIVAVERDTAVIMAAIKDIKEAVRDLAYHVPRSDNRANSRPGDRDDVGNELPLLP